MRRLAIAMILAGALPPAAEAHEAAPGPELPGWMAGCWEAREGGNWTEECWTAPRGGQMMGSSRTGSGDKVAGFEFMRIERAERRLVFLAAPGGKGWSSFPSAPDAEGGVTFLNAEHDYPQRVRYWRDGDRLMAEIALGDGSHSRRWAFTRSGG